MPINNISSSSGMEMQSIGTAWKGQKRTFDSKDRSKTRAGADLKDRFRVVLPSPLDGIFRAAYGSDEPKLLRVFFPFDQVDQVFERWNDAMTAQGLKHRCDGDRIVRQVIKKTGYRGGKSYGRRCREDCDLPCQRAENEVICSECTSTGYLSFYVREIIDYAGHSKVVTQTVTGITDVVGLHDQLVAFQQKYGSLKRSPVPSPSTFEMIPFTLQRVEREISRPHYDADTRSYTDNYTRMKAYPILVTEDPAWLHHWTLVVRRMRIQEMVKAGQAALLMPEDLAILKQMQAIEFQIQQSLGAMPPGAIAPIESSPVAIAPAIDTEAIADAYCEDDEESPNGEAYAKEKLTRTDGERILAVNAVLPTVASRDRSVELWQSLQDKAFGVDRCSQFIRLLIIEYAVGQHVKESTIQAFLDEVEDLNPYLVDEDLAAFAVSEIPRLGDPPCRESPTVVGGHSID